MLVSVTQITFICTFSIELHSICDLAHSILPANEYTSRLSKFAQVLNHECFSNDRAHYRDPLWYMGLGGYQPGSDRLGGIPRLHGLFRLPSGRPARTGDQHADLHERRLLGCGHHRGQRYSPRVEHSGLHADRRRGVPDVHSGTPAVAGVCAWHIHWRLCDICGTGRLAFGGHLIAGWTGFRIRDEKQRIMAGETAREAAAGREKYARTRSGKRLGRFLKPRFYGSLCEVSQAIHPDLR